jgi:hypothetical protein
VYDLLLLCKVGLWFYGKEKDCKYMANDVERLIC